MHGWIEVYRNQFSILALERIRPNPNNIHFTDSSVAAEVRVSRGGPGQWGFVNLVRAGTQQP